MHYSVPTLIFVTYRNCILMDIRLISGIRNYLLEDEDHKCPTCHEENVSPDKLIINQSVRQSVKDFKNEGLYEKPAKQLSPPPPPPPRTTTSTIVIGSPLKLDTR